MGVGRAGTPHPWGSQRWKQGRDREDGVTCDPSSREGAPSLLFLHLPLHPAGREAFFLLAPLSPNLGASVGSRAGPWWLGQNPGLEPMGA